MTKLPGDADATLPLTVNDLLEQKAATPKGGQEVELSLVTIVVTCYNSARYLAAALESALAQTYPRVEVIVVDDGSTDETAAIARSYPVSYFYQKNRGSATARNTGIAQSQGEYILFLDHDDRLLPTALEICVRLFKDHPECTIAVGEHRYIGPDGAALGSSNKLAGGRDHYRTLLQHNFIETPSSAMHRRSGLNATGLFDETVQGAEDYELYLRTARQSAFITDGRIIAEYRLHPTSATRNAERMLAVTHRVLDMELPYLGKDPEKLRLRQEGIRFFQRHYGRRLMRELMDNRSPKSEEYRRKLKTLRRYYPAGFAAVVANRLLPAKLLHRLLILRSPM